MAKLYQQSGTQNSMLDLAREIAGWRKNRMILVFAATLALSVLLGAAIVKIGAVSFFVILAILIGIPVAYAMIVHPKAGIIILLTTAYIIMFFARLVDFPIGTVMDVMEVLLIFSFLLKQKYEKNWAALKSPTTGVILLWIGYNLLEVANPSAASLQAWLYAVRPIALVTLTYFLFLYFIRDARFIRLIFKLWICLSFIAAIYALKQEFFGFSAFERHWIQADPHIGALYFIGNHWRRFSIFSDPVAFSYNMVISSILCFCLAIGTTAKWKKICLRLLSALFFYAMLYSGTRGAYILFPAAFLLFSVLRYNKKILLIGLFGLAAVTCLVFKSTSNYTLYRFQSAFHPDHDASYNLRQANQKRIQPYIQSHPLGGGIGSTGVWGQRFSPYSYLANFPPDSGYVRVAVEMGWIGLFIFCTFMFVILKTGITNYFRIRNPQLKSYCLAMLLILFALNLGNYPQEAIVQYPTNIYFYLAVALLSVTARIDDSEQNIIAYNQEEIKITEENVPA